MRENFCYVTSSFLYLYMKYMHVFYLFFLSTGYIIQMYLINKVHAQVVGDKKYIYRLNQVLLNHVHILYCDKI